MRDSCSFFFPIILFFSLFPLASQATDGTLPPIVEACHAKFPIFDMPQRARGREVNKVVDAFINCIGKDDVDNAAFLMVRANANLLAASYEKTGGAHRNMMIKDFCKAAELGHVYGQQQCGSWLIDSNPAQAYRWTMAAALNGSRAAQDDISNHAWPKQASAGRDQEFDRYIVQYLGCHPAMFAQSDICQPSSRVLSAGDAQQCRTERKAALYAAVGACQQDLRMTFSKNIEKSVLEKWDQEARQQLEATLKNIREQIRRFPELSQDSLIQ